jgi:aminopeptidase-like protein
MERMGQMLQILWPMHRTINCDDLDRAIEMCRDYIGLPNFTIHRYEPGSEVLTWIVPDRYHVREAWLEVGGKRIADFAENPLHLLSYSLPWDFEGTLGEARAHIWTRKDRPDAIPWEFKYYERSYGFCVRYRDIMGLPDETPVKARIDVAFGSEPMPVGDFNLKGESGDDILFLTNICHPAQVNDSIAGLVVGLEMARQLAARKNRRHGFRLLIVPETIGTIAWFHHNQIQIDRIRHAWFCEMVGHDNSFILQRSRQGDAQIDRAFLSILQNHRRHGEERTGLFRKVVASDEMVTNGPGYNIPTPSLTRWPYDEYHTSDDNPDIIRPENLWEALQVCLGVWDALEKNYYPLRTFKGPIMLSRYGLWIDWRIDWNLNLKTEAIMLMLEGDHSVIDIAYELELPFNTVFDYLERIYQAGLIKKKSYSERFDGVPHEPGNDTNE